MCRCLRIAAAVVVLLHDSHSTTLAIFTDGCVLKIVHAAGHAATGLEGWHHGRAICDTAAILQRNQNLLLFQVTHIHDGTTLAFSQTVWYTVFL